jgi:putative salt-induced outer membrane protein YdiY
MLLGCLSVSAVPADEVRLLNGDRVTGQVAKIESGRLSISTPYAGDVGIDIKQIRTLQIDEPVSITIDKTGSVRAAIRPDGDGKVILVAEDWLETEPVALTRITALSRTPEPPVRLTGRINVGTSATSGNTDTSKLHVDLELVARSVVNRFTFGAAADHAEDRGTTTESNGLAYLKYDHFLSEKWYVYSNATAERDRFKDIRLRTTLGAGTGYQFLETTKTNLSLEGGANYVNIDSYVGEDDAFPAARLALRFERLILGERLQFFLQDELYADAQGSDNTFVRTQTGLRMAVLQKARVTLQYNMDWDADPAPGRVSTDRAVLLTLGYLW